jgi:hypothetical protein
VDEQETIQQTKEQPEDAVTKDEEEVYPDPEEWWDKPGEYWEKTNLENKEDEKKDDYQSPENQGPTTIAPATTSSTRGPQASGSTHLGAAPPAIAPATTSSSRGPQAIASGSTHQGAARPVIAPATTSSTSSSGRFTRGSLNRRKPEAETLNLADRAFINRQTQGLHPRCKVEIKATTLNSPVGELHLGAFATRDYREGEFIEAYGGRNQFISDLTDEDKTYTRPVNVGRGASQRGYNAAGLSPLFKKDGDSEVYLPDHKRATEDQITILKTGLGFMINTSSMYLYYYTIHD